MAGSSGSTGSTGEARGRGARAGARRQARRVVRRQAVVRRLDPWSVLKLSLVFYLFLLVVFLLGLVVLWAVIDRLGIIDQAFELMEAVDLPVVELDLLGLAQTVALIGLLQVVFLTALNVFLAFLYNLVSELIGGLKVTLAEEQRVAPPAQAPTQTPGQAPAQAPTQAAPAATSAQHPPDARGAADASRTERLD